MLPSSHPIPIKAVPVPGVELAEAFSDFISASSRLELSYRELQERVAELTLRLSERNRALSDSLSENRNMGHRMERILEAMPCGVLVVSADGVPRVVNPEAARLLQVWRGQGGASEFPGSGAGCHREFRSLYESAHEFEQELSFESPTGQYWIAVRKVPLMGLESNGSIPRHDSVIMLRDISAYKRIERERETARDAVALAQVSALLAHEIRNPLASLELFAALITEDPEKTDEWISHLQAGIRSLAGTVNNVLTLHAGSAVVLQPINVALEAALSVSFLQPLAAQACVNLVLEAESEDVWCRSTGTAFQQILLNLCTNALRHTPAGGLVRVVCSAPANAEDHVRIAVVDTGSGISHEHLPRLFEAGYSGSGVTPGLGLAVCDRLIRQHGGAIHVSSRLGHGSTFTLELPQA